MGVLIHRPPELKKSSFSVRTINLIIAKQMFSSLGRFDCSIVIF